VIVIEKTITITIGDHDHDGFTHHASRFTFHALPTPRVSQKD
jgi:hypothetical protein